MRERDKTLTTDQKALAINLDKYKFGTIVEIGAGQEVARHFFQVGAAAGTIAKTMSAYDMAISDDIYGQVDRYVSRERLMQMLDKEFSKVVTRLVDVRPKNTTFFAYAATVTARSFKQKIQVPNPAISSCTCACSTTRTRSSVTRWASWGSISSTVPFSTPRSPNGSSPAWLTGSGPIALKWISSISPDSILRTSKIV
mgnify:CR=1 FL=1